MKPQVLFVDDDHGVREGLRRALRRYRERFECHFAASAAQARTLLETQSFDLALIDLSLPDVDGVSLLAYLRDNHPVVVRAAFSGTCEVKQCIDALTFAHRFVSKPVTPDRLAEHISECLAAGGGCHNAFAAALRSLSEPSAMPAVHAEALRELSARDPSRRNLVEIIQRDIGITARLLKLANSSWFGAPRPVTSLDRACGQLGFENVRAAVLLLGVMSERGAGIGDIGEHGMAVGELAATLVAPDARADVRAAALLHDIGRVGFARVAPHEYAATSAEHGVDECALAASESLRFGGNHAQCGGFLLSLWGLPQATVEIVAAHHDDPVCPSGYIDGIDALRLAERAYAGALTEWAERGDRRERGEIVSLVLANAGKAPKQAVGGV
ncbi:MAG: HDOD domain-containing protein [Deltaproteobacteria bacterium]|nr:HDOD domain-containing protein [Deltaproteobacteria bacterium]MBK8240256.1 HDOD domain-containing protein [Deltaproteobacteria bacterium]MBK8714588.1 HDOD domain-containing protein [Deltaproteobacteria bacterium]MBP7290029.1 HDOD domain-containing protein [Nannocystaceae bacterium]